MATSPVLTLLSVNGVVAQIDTDPDGIGIYFDEMATQVTETAGALEYVEGYIIATNISQSGGIVFWEAYVHVEGAADVIGSPVVGHNVHINMPGDPNYHFVVIIDMEDLLIIQEITILAHLNIQVIESGAPIQLYLTGAMPSENPYYSIEDYGEPYYDLYPSSGSLQLPVAVINGEPPIAAKDSTWGRLKTLYK